MNKREKKMLNDAERQKVEENHNLIYWYAHLVGLNLDDWYDLLAIELCYAVKKHNKDRSSLSTYYKMRCDGLVSREKRKEMTKKRFHFKVQYIENIHDDQCQYDMNGLVDNDVLHDEEFGEIIKMRYDGFTQQEIAKKMGASQSYISNVFKRLKKKYYDNNR